ncbi:hypothetical protein [Candidatus Poriferisodalis sp.]|uniref:hypothetical protein n=1 Tax=Candidatus Poriferisodalis sp. TaxID=3101277 RepID=UPI003B01E0A3
MRRRRSLIVRSAVGAFLAMASLLMPVDPPLTPESLSVGSQPAHAQVLPPSHVAGTALNCPAGMNVASWNESDCYAELDACPYRPLQDDPAHPSHSTRTRMAPHDSYVDFCVEHIVDDDAYTVESNGSCLFGTEELLGCTPSTADFAECPNSLWLNQAVNNHLYSSYLRVTAIETVDAAPPFPAYCRIIKAKQCTDGSRIDRDLCLQVMRRLWECPAGAVPTNRFNVCYMPAGTPSAGTPDDPHPCADGAPAFPLGDCGTYVGDDYYRNNSSSAPVAPCPSSYVTGGGYAMTAWSGSGIALGHWCEYNAALLGLECHQTGAACDPVPAICLKRASDSGGCRSVIDTIGCRELQAQYSESIVDVQTVLGSDCEPCVLMLFGLQPEGQCTSDAVSEVTVNPSHHANSCYWRTLLQDPITLPLAGRGAVNLPHLSFCSGYFPSVENCAPMTGNLSWRSLSTTRLANVGTVVVVRFHNITTGVLSGYMLHANAALGTAATMDDIHQQISVDELRYVYAVNSIDQLFPEANNQIHVRCRIFKTPRFFIQARELWPDNGPVYQESNSDCVVVMPAATTDTDAALIQQHFGGTDALGWWCGLTAAERVERTEQRGLSPWSGLTTADEREERNKALTEVVDCQSEDDEPVWCPWRPSRPGYYLLYGQGVWRIAAQYNLDIAELDAPGDAPHNSAVSWGYSETAPVGVEVYQTRVSARTPAG